MTAAVRAANGRFAAQPDTLAGHPSQRQVEALDLVADGLPNHVIARRLEISPDAVADRLKNAAVVLGRSNRAAMVGECYRRGVFVRRPGGEEPPAVAGGLLALLPLVAVGQSHAVMAKSLGVSEDTVTRRMAALRWLLGAVSGVHLVRRGVDLGLLAADLELAGPLAPAEAAVASEPVVASGPAVAARPKPVPAPVPVASLLSPPEERVLRMLAFGVDADAIATRLRVGPGAVRETVRGAMTALGARTLPHAVLLACQAGILPGGAP